MALRCRHLRGATESRFPRDLPTGLGDDLEKVLEKFGITKERFSEFTKKYKAKLCNCEGRHNFVNLVGSVFGMSPGRSSELREELKTTNRGEQRIFECEIHGRCIKRQTFSEAVVASIEALGVKPCRHCDNFESE